MSTRSKFRRFKKGSALIAVILFVFVMALLTGSMLTYTTSERRANERTRLLLRARNMAENVAIYASEQLTTKLRRLRSQTPMAFMTGANAIAKPPASVLETQYSTVNDVEVRAGLTGSTPFTYIDPANPANASNPNAGLQVSTSSVPIVAKATMRHPSIGAITAYAEQDLEIAMIPLFQFAVFYNMDMEFGPGPNMTISGPVHTNGNLIARIQTGMTNTLAFQDRVTAAGGFFANTAHKGPTYMAAGNVDNGPGGDGPLNFQSPSGTVTNIRTGSTWRDHKWGGGNVTATSLNSFKSFASSAYGGNLRTSVHGVTTLDLPAIGGYKEVDDPATPEDDRKNGRQLIEPAVNTDDAALKETKFARKAGLYIVVNPDDEDRVGRLPDASLVTMRARSYRCWLNTVNADLSHTLFEVVLPGQPSYGPLNAYLNNLPNAYRKDTSVGHNQVLRIPKAAAELADTGYAVGTPSLAGFQDAFFYDMRRATHSTGAPFNRPAQPFTPRPIAKIDLDLTRFKMAVERTLLDATTSSVYHPSLPTTAATWDRFIYNPAATPTAHGLGLGPTFDTFPGQDVIHAIKKNSNNIYAPNQIVINGYTRSGTSTANAYAGRLVIYDSPDGTTWTARYASPGYDESAYSYTPNANIAFVRVQMYLAGAAPAAGRLLDDEIIPIVSDGTTTTLMALSNDSVIIPSDTGGANPVFTDAFSEVRVYVNGTDDTANWTYDVSASSGGVSGSFGTTAGTLNRYSLTAMTSSTTGSVTLRATHKFSTATLTRTMNLQKQSNVAAIASPTRTGRWLTVSALPGADPFRMYFAPADPNHADIRNNPSTFAVTPSNLVNTATPYSPWFDGVTIYVHSVEAENKTRSDGAAVDATHPPDRIDSGVRLWNGRGSLISLDGATYPARTGFSFASNDAVYVVGHYNADGVVNSSTSATGTGGYSGRYPEAASEMLTAVMGDAITILSQPSFTSSGGAYYQTAGWSDSLSAHRRTDTSTGYTTAWATTNPGASNTQDGLNTSVRPARMPNLSDIVASGGLGVAPVVDAKFAPSVTEVSTCLLTGIVPTTNSQTSGGVHNFPRLLEDWSTGGPFALYIRGSMVAMFQSQVGTEPWSIRYYQGAVRNWGLHQSLRNVNHDLPLEPIVLSAQRMRYRELTPTEYATMKTTIEALPH